MTPMNTGARLARRRQLRDLANEQGGYFTTRQAEALGFVKNNHPFHVASGSWLRERRGIYRLPGVTVRDPAIAELHMWLLWTIGRADAEPRGAIAYETALTVFGLSDLMIHRVHLSVPKNFRVSVLPPEVVLHREERPLGDLTRFDGLRVVRAMVTILDLMREGRVSLEHIERGFKDGLTHGEITRAEVSACPTTAAEMRQLQAWSQEMDPQ